MSMSDGEKPQTAFERAQAAVCLFEEEQNHYLGMLGFDWRTAPRVDHGVISTHPLNRPASMQLTQRDGRFITLCELHQYFVYQGTLCGVPPTPEDELANAVKTAQRLFPTLGQRPVVLEPTFHVATFETQAGRKPFPYPLIWLPKICTIAVFDSTAPLSTSTPLYSSAVVIWFQESYGIVTDAQILEQLRDVEWDLHAVDTTP